MSDNENFILLVSESSRQTSLHVAEGTCNIYGQIPWKEEDSLI